ncbi:hypothetical protein KPL76_03500 [Subtercola sp. PAMC28395]|uniref:hypothetical protein n=1 Tax=Subtercola sp. PAMC28395 TaxID=2846775 RepID=UPI001C0C85F1|nr:hypothetical protein [Subtercola sp. PAMC28395]QWT24475.1 hypothetical protein KPL76_03500 [Subtercola sp. PAMC28395]
MSTRSTGKRRAVGVTVAVSAASLAVAGIGSGVLWNSTAQAAAARTSGSTQQSQQSTSGGQSQQGGIQILPGRRSTQHSTSSGS